MTRDYGLNARVAAVMARQAQEDAARALARAKIKGCTQEIHRAQRRVDETARLVIKAEVDFARLMENDD